MIQLARTKYGIYQCVQSPKGYSFFKGIPYAKPPVGSLRFCPPEPPESFSGIRVCDAFGPAAMQGPFALSDGSGHERIPVEGYSFPPKMSEDCLYLNVCTPAEKASDRLPVMLYIHGGAMQTWYGSCYEYDPEGLCSYGVVVVNIHYRLNVFGFFAHPELSRESVHQTSGNYGILDMIAALRWVKENIESFGGNPENITIFGQSSGARGVQCIACSPLGAGLFQHAAMASGGAIYPFPSIESGEPMEKRGEEFLRFCGLSNLSELRALSEKALADFSLRFMQERHLSFNLYADGYVLPLSVEDAAAQGLYHKADYLVGCTVDEGHTGAEGEGFFAMFKRICPAVRAFARLLRDHGQEPYVYCFDRPQPGDNIGTPHSSDNRYIFGSFAESWRPFTQEDFYLSEVMQKYWTNFAKTGSPDGEDLPVWEKFGEDGLEMHLTLPQPYMYDPDPSGELRMREDQILAEII